MLSSAKPFVLTTHEVTSCWIVFFSAFPRLPVALDGKLVEITKETDVAEVFAPLLLASTVKKHKSKAKPTLTQELVTKDNNMQQKRKKRKRT